MPTMVKVRDGGAVGRGRGRRVARERNVRASFATIPGSAARSSSVRAERSSPATRACMSMPASSPRGWFSTAVSVSGRPDELREVGVAHEAPAVGEHLVEQRLGCVRARQVASGDQPVRVAPARHVDAERRGQLRRLLPHRRAVALEHERLHGLHVRHRGQRGHRLVVDRLRAPPAEPPRPRCAPGTSASSARGAPRACRPGCRPPPCRRSCSRSPATRRSAAGSPRPRPSRARAAGSPGPAPRSA